VVAYLSKSQLLHLHQQLIKRFGGPAGLRDEGALDSALARPQATFDGEDLYATLAEKAAALFQRLVSNHPFLDGNERLAAISVELFLLANGHELVASDDDLEELVMSSARGELAVEEIAIWLDQRLTTLRV
jgi:death on curing protein